MASRYFPTTRRSLIRDASTPGPKRRRAVREMCDAYRSPSLEYCRRRLYFDPSLAEDVVQDVFGSMLSEAGLERLREFEGSFGAFLSGALDHRIDNEIRTRMTAKRGAGARTQSLDDGPEPVRGLGHPDGRGPETLFFEIITQHHLVLALARVAERWDKRGRGEAFERLAPQLFRRGHGDDIAQSAEDRRDLRRLRLAVHKSLQDVGGDWVNPDEVEAECKRWLEHLQMDPAVPPAAKPATKKPSRKPPSSK